MRRWKTRIDADGSKYMLKVEKELMSRTNDSKCNLEGNGRDYSIMENNLQMYEFRIREVEEEKLWGLEASWCSNCARRSISINIFRSNLYHI